MLSMKCHSPLINHLKEMVTNNIYLLKIAPPMPHGIKNASYCTFFTHTLLLLDPHPLFTSIYSSHLSTHPHTQNNNQRHHQNTYPPTYKLIRLIQLPKPQCFIILLHIHPIRIHFHICRNQTIRINHFHFTLLSSTRSPRSGIWICSSSTIISTTTIICFQSSTLPCPPSCTSRSSNTGTLTTTSWCGLCYGEGSYASGVGDSAGGGFVGFDAGVGCLIHFIVCVCFFEFGKLLCFESHSHSMSPIKTLL
mmetsp:Transcript_20165/g.30698  ORF Transcript_20165/g.30698 Transcript_20165/m.30698 type:complete len:250 (+) Transcript_20165:146-895(+)